MAHLKILSPIHNTLRMCKVAELRFISEWLILLRPCYVLTWYLKDNFRTDLKVLIVHVLDWLCSSKLENPCDSCIDSSNIYRFRYLIYYLGSLLNKECINFKIFNKLRELYFYFTMIFLCFIQNINTFKVIFKATMGRLYNKNNNWLLIILISRRPFLSS